MNGFLVGTILFGLQAAGLVLVLCGVEVVGKLWTFTGVLFLTLPATLAIRRGQSQEESHIHIDY